MKKISNELVLEFAKEQNIDNLLPSFNAFQNILTSAIDNVISHNLQLLAPEDIFTEIIGDYNYGTNSGCSQMQIAVCVNSPQIELNSEVLIESKWEKLKNKLQYVWINRKRSSRRRAIRKQKKLEQTKLLQKESPYTISKFQYELFTEICNSLPQTCSIENSINGINITAKMDLGLNFKIIPFLKIGNHYKFWNKHSNSFDLFDFNIINKMIKSKETKLGDSFLKIYRILNNLYFAINKQLPPKFFIEFVIASIDEILFTTTNFEKLFYNVVNFIINKDVNLINRDNEMFSILNKDTFDNYLSLYKRFGRNIKSCIE